VEVPKRAIDITAENAKALRELFRQSIETYSAFENLQKLINETVHGDYWTHAFGGIRGALQRQRPHRSVGPC
jgi:hypothetical protein